MLRSVLVMVIALVGLSLAYADEPLPAILQPPAVEQPVTHWLDGGGNPEPLFGIDVMLGQQTGIRPNVAVWRGANSSVVVEGYYGSLLTKLGTSEGAGGGVRWLFGRSSRSGCDGVVVGPGIDILQNFADGQATLLAPSVDFAWRHPFGDRGGWTLGLNVGVGIGAGGRDDGHNGDPASGQVTPLISGFFGLRY